MNDKHAATILLALIEKQILTPEEEEAVRSAIGVLSWTSLAEGRMNAIKKKRERDAQ